MKGGETLRVDENIARDVFQRIVQAYQDQTHIYSVLHETAQPERFVLTAPIWPTPRQQAHALLCLAQYMRGPVNSFVAMKNLVEALADGKADWTEPTVAAKLDEKILCQLFIDRGLTGRAAENAKFWVSNAKILVDEGCDLGDLLRPAGSFARAWYVLCGEKIDANTDYSDLKAHNFRGFKGIGKVAALLFGWLMDIGYLDLFQLPVPVDVHFLRICLATRLLQVDKSDRIGHTAIGSFMRDQTIELCPRFGVDPRELSNGSWLLGSNVCTKHRQMRMNVLPSERRKENRKSRRPSAKIPKPIQHRLFIPEVPRERSRLNRRCIEQCPIEELCRLNIPTGLYHDRGLIAIIEILEAKGLI
jgi:hypothetical protein